MAESVRVGVIGLGRSGWSIHAETIARHERFTVAAVADPEPERRQEAVERFGCAAHTEPGGLIADASVELVVVASPSHLHAPLSCAALRAGKHVLVEKPMATSAAEADEMLAAQRESGRLLTVYQIRRLDPDFRRIQEIIASGVLGPVHQIRMAGHGYQRRRDWQTLRRYGGGQLNNNGAHALDQALVLAGGEWRDLFADLRQVAAAGDADDHVKIVFRGRDGIVLDVELAVSPYGGPYWTLMAKHGGLTGDQRRIEWKSYDPAALPPVEVDERAAVPGRRYGTGETIPWVTESEEFTPGDTAALFYDHLYASLREGAPLLVPPEESRNLMALLEAAHQQAGL